MPLNEMLEVHVLTIIIAKIYLRVAKCYASISHTLAHLFSPMRYLTDARMELQKVSNFPKIIQLGSGRTSIPRETF